MFKLAIQMLLGFLYISSTHVSNVYEKMNTSQNASLIFPFDIQWNIFAVTRLTILVSSFVLNSCVLLVYIIRPNLRTPFSVYLIALLISNLLDLILFYPFATIANLGTPRNRFFLGERGCIANIYGTTIIRSLCLCSHALITLNRIWAMTYPHSYKNHHGPRFATGLCTGVAVALHCFGIPAMLTNEKTRPRPVERFGCWYKVTSDSFVNASAYILFYMLPLCIVGSYPYLFYKYLQNRNKILQENRSETAQSWVPARGTTKPSGNRNRTFRIVTLLSAFTIICWLPEQVIIVTQMAGGEKYILAAYPIANLLSSFQTLLDPIFLLISLKDLRDNLRGLFVRKK